MTIEPQAPTPLTVLPLLLTVLAFILPSALSAQTHQPPPEPPDEWGPISINMEEIEYPYPVEFMNLRVYDQDVRIAYMDVAPVGSANGRAVVFHHGGSYYGWYWKEQIGALTNEGYRVIVKDRLGWGKSSKPILPYSMSLHASNTARLMEHLGLSEAAIVGHSIGGQMATRFAFLYPEMTTHLVTINQIGLTDNRAGRGFRPFDGEIDADPDMQRAYEGRRADRDATLCRVEAGVSGPSPYSARATAERRLAATRVRAPAWRHPALDGYGGERLAPHRDEDAHSRRRDRRAELPRECAAGGGDSPERGGRSHPERRP